MGVKNGMRANISAVDSNTVGCDNNIFTYDIFCGGERNRALFYFFLRLRPVLKSFKKLFFQNGF